MNEKPDLTGTRPMDMISIMQRGLQEDLISTVGKNLLDAMREDLKLEIDEIIGKAEADIESLVKTELAKVTLDHIKQYSSLSGLRDELVVYMSYGDDEDKTKIGDIVRG